MTLASRDKTLTLVGILLALFLGALDQTIVSTALPRIVEDLQGLGRFAWVATAYLLASTVLVPIYGKLADMYSRKRIELFAIGIFLSGSFLCGLAGEFGSLPLLGDGMTQLIVFRALQGIGGAGLFSLAFIIIADLYPPSVRGRYQGLVGATFGIASVLGPWIGGLLTDYGDAILPGIEGWRWVFYVNVPFGAVAVWFIVRRMPPLTPAGRRDPLDLLSAAFLILGFLPLVLALQLDKTDHPWGSPVTLGMFTAAAVFLVLFVARSLRSRNPILDLTLFRNRVFSLSNSALFFVGASFLVVLIFLPLFLVNVVGVSATRAGVSLIPLSLGVVSGAIAAGQLVSAFGRYRLLMLIGGAILLVGVVLLSTMPASIPYWQVTVYMIIVGVGIGPSLPLYTLAIQNAVDVRKVGQATSASQFFRQIGGTVGTAVMGTILASSLAASFQNVDLGMGPAPEDFRARESASSGAAALEEGIRSAFADRFRLIAEALEKDDTEELRTVLEASPLPEAAREGVLLGAAATAGSEEARAAFLERMRDQFQRTADEVVGRALERLETSIRDAVTTIYRYLIYVVVIALGLTFFIPVLTLRTSNEPVPADT